MSEPVPPIWRTAPLAIGKDKDNLKTARRLPRKANQAFVALLMRIFLTPPSLVFPLMPFREL